jgi:hypothetical protein
MSEPSKPCEWALDRIEPYLDGEIDDGERTAFEAHCVSCADCARELSLGIRLRRELRSLKIFDVPPGVIERAASEIATASSNVVPLRTSRPHRRIVLPAIAAAILAVVATLWFTSERRQYGGYTQQDIERAHAEMALAFSYVDRYSDGVVREEVIQKRVVPSIERAIRENESNVTSPPPGRS